MRLLLVLGVVVAGMLVALVALLRTSAPTVAVPPRRDAAAIAPVRADAMRGPAPLLAIAIDAPAPASARAEVIARLHESGSGVEPWDDQGQALLASLAHDGVEIRDSGCFIAGCGATYTFPSEAEYRRRFDEFAASDLYRAWTGGKRITDPERIRCGWSRNRLDRAVSAGLTASLMGNFGAADEFDVACPATCVIRTRRDSRRFFHIPRRGVQPFLAEHRRIGWHVRCHRSAPRRCARNFPRSRRGPVR